MRWPMYFPGLKGLWILQDHLMGHRFFFCRPSLEGNSQKWNVAPGEQPAKLMSVVWGLCNCLVELSKDACLVHLPAFQLFFVLETSDGGFLKVRAVYLALFQLCSACSKESVIAFFFPF